MKFLYPQFLYALFFIAIPIIIHLFNFRKYKKIAFPNVQFLKEVKQETKSQSKLKHRLVLLSRILAIIFLVFAFAQPYLPVEKNTIAKGDNSISIYIDNSFSMDAIGNNSSLLTQAKQYVNEIANSYQATDNFQLLTNDFETRHQRFVNKEELLEWLDEVDISPTVKSTAEVLSRQLDMLSKSKNNSKSIFLLSDFQKSIADFSQLANNDTTVNINLIPIYANDRNNLFIDSCWFETPIRQLKQSEKLFVRIKNLSNEDYENIPIKISVNGNQKALASYNIQSNASAIVPLSFTINQTGVQNAVVSITDYPVTFDDEFYLSFEIVEKVNVLNIYENDSNASIYALFGKDAFFDLHNVLSTQLDYSSFNNYSLIIINELQTISSGLNQEIIKFMTKGGSIVLFPNLNVEPIVYQDFLSSIHVDYFTSLDTSRMKVTAINYNSTIWNNVFDKDKLQVDNLDLPFVKKHYRTKKNTLSKRETIIQLQNDEAMLSVYPFEKGKIYVFNTSLQTDASNLTQHALFVPTLYNIALLSQHAQALFYTIGKDEKIEINVNTTNKENIFHIKGNEFDIIPEIRNVGEQTNIYLHNQIKQDGFYSLTMDDSSQISIAFNYDRKESDLNCLSEEEIVEQYTKEGLSNFSIVESQNKILGSSISNLHQGKQFWRFCIIISLLFLLFEIILIRLWKQA